TTSHQNADKNTNVFPSDDNNSINFIGNSNDFNSENDNTGCSFKSIGKTISPRPSSLSLSSSFYSSALCLSSSSSSSSCQQADVFNASRNNNAKPHEKERKVVNSTNSSSMFSKGRVLDFYNTNFYGSINFNSMIDPNEIFNDNNN
ncbi:hypothetical protein HELRODRAFT_151686, partial [Helobdella robusta]|uniref:Uncharacterized protein n=1 Tax=Helobdella robusta TaxID=6412 RepID=T1EKL7_HELRO